MNSIKTFLLMFGLIALFVYIGGLVGGHGGMIVAFGAALVMNFVSYWFSDSIVLAMYGAKKVNTKDMPRLNRIVNNMAQAANLPIPSIYIMDTTTPNAFATGRNPNHAAVAVTSGIVDLLTDDELEGVLAHELSHVKNRDILVGTIAATVAGAIYMLARVAQFGAMFSGGNSRSSDRSNAFTLIAMAIIAPLAATIIQLAISRSREYMADKSGAQISGKPLALASALQKISGGVKADPMNASPVTAHMFIVNPLSGRGLMNLFSTHPPVEERVKRLEEIAAGR